MEIREGARNMEINSPEKGEMYYDFCQYAANSMIPGAEYHPTGDFICSTSKHDVYFVECDRIYHWNALTSKTSVVLDLSGDIGPSEEHPENIVQGFTEIQVTTMAIWDKLLIVGGIDRELIVKRIDRPGVSFCFRTTSTEGATTTAIEIYKHLSGAIHFMASNEEGSVKVYDTEKFQLLNHLSFPWPVNHTSLSPDGRQLVVVGQNQEGKLVDSETGKTISPLSGHTHDSINSSAWHPDGYIFATGNQDKTCHIWDVRNLSNSVVVLNGNLGGISSLRFTSDGQFMAMAESCDYVHLYDVKSGFGKEQEMEFFGYISGFSLSPDTESLFIAVTVDSYPCVLLYNRRRM